MVDKKSCYGIPLEVINCCYQNEIRWIKKSFEKNGGMGSSAFQHFFGWWSKPYPETTGYLIPSLLRAYDKTADQCLEKLALAQWSYFERIQNADGSFVSDNDKGKSYFFDNSQILYGLRVLENRYKHIMPEDRTTRLYNWLLDQISEKGLVVNNNYNNYSTPAYYSRACWSLLHFEKSNKIKHHPKVLALLETIWSKRMPNGFFKDAGLAPEKYVLTHTLAYTYRGLWECFNVLNDQTRRAELEELLEISFLSIFNNKSNEFYGSYDKNWRSDKSFVCTTGNAQFAIIFLLSEKKDNAWVIEKLISPLFNEVGLFYHFPKAVLPSSIPLWGSYQRLRYTNWTQKFFLDLLLLLQDRAS